MVKSQECPEFPTVFSVAVTQRKKFLKEQQWNHSTSDCFLFFWFFSHMTAIQIILEMGG